MTISSAKIFYFLIVILKIGIVPFDMTDDDIALIKGENILVGFILQNNFKVIFIS